MNRALIIAWLCIFPAVAFSQTTPTVETAPPTQQTDTKQNDGQEPTEDLVARLQLLARRSEELARETEDLRRQRASARAEAERLRTENASLRERLQRVQDIALTQISLVDRFWNDRKASAQFKTDGLARLVARLKEVGGREFPEQRSELSTQHVFHWDGLAAEREYRLSVAALDLTGQETKVTLSGSSLDFTTTSPDSGPIISFAPELTALTSSTITFTYTLSEPAYVALECRQRVSAKSIDTIPCRRPVIGKVEFNDVGRPMAEKKMSGTQTVTVDGLDPNTEYVFMPVAYDDRGLELQNAKSSPLYATAHRLDFAGPVNLEVAPAKVRLSWKATAQPTDAQVRLHFSENQKFERPAKYTAADQLLTAEIPLTELTRAIEADPRSAKPPVIEIEMNGDTGPLVRQFSVAFVVPSSTAALTEPQRNAIRSLGDAIASPNKAKVSWKNMIELGLPIVLSFL